MQSSEERNYLENIPPFICKLWKMVNNPSTNHLISWNKSGSSFIIHNKVQFYNELPLHFKHKELISFIRQVHIYGFKKANQTYTSDLTMEYYNRHFQKNEPHKLKNLKRYASKRPYSKPRGVRKVSRCDDLRNVVTDVNELRRSQLSVDSQLSAMTKENAALWKELVILRQEHKKQQQIISKVVLFFDTLVKPLPSARISEGIQLIKSARATKGRLQHSRPSTVT